MGGTVRHGDIAAALNELGGTFCDPELRIYTEQDEEFKGFCLRR